MQALVIRFTRQAMVAGVSSERCESSSSSSSSVMVELVYTDALGGEGDVPLQVDPSPSP